MKYLAAIVLASFLIPTATADGIPFEDLQQQIDQLSQRVGAIEAKSSPAGQTCPAGQLVSGFQSNGVVVCASAGGTAGDTQLPSAIQVLLQRGFLVLNQSSRPLNIEPFETVAGTVIQPTRYHLTFYSLNVTQSSAQSASIQLALHATVILASGFSVGGNLSVTVGTGIAATPSGMRRLVDVQGTSVSIDGPLMLNEMVSHQQRIANLPFAFHSDFMSDIRSIVTTAATEVFATLPEF